MLGLLLLLMLHLPLLYGIQAILLLTLHQCCLKNMSIQKTSDNVCMHPRAGVFAYWFLKIIEDKSAYTWALQYLEGRHTSARLFTQEMVSY